MNYMRIIHIHILSPIPQVCSTTSRRVIPSDSLRDVVHTGYRSQVLHCSLPSLLKLEVWLHSIPRTTVEYLPLRWSPAAIVEQHHAVRRFVIVGKGPRAVRRSNPVACPTVKTMGSLLWRAAAH